MQKTHFIRSWRNWFCCNLQWSNWSYPAVTPTGLRCFINDAAWMCKGGWMDVLVMDLRTRRKVHLLACWCQHFLNIVQ
jgi:hypothetical protein